MSKARYYRTLITWQSKLLFKGVLSHLYEFLYSIFGKKTLTNPVGGGYAYSIKAISREWSGAQGGNGLAGESRRNSAFVLVCEGAEVRTAI